MQRADGHTRSGGQPDNLWDPVDDQADAGVRGGFDGPVRTSSTQMWLSRHREAVLTATVAAGAAAVAATVARHGRSGRA